MTDRTADIQSAGRSGALTVRWQWMIATAMTILFGIAAVAAFLRVHGVSQMTDFVSFWAAALLSVQGNPVLAYDVEVHRGVERSVGTIAGLMPFPYPPPFLLLVTPLGLLPYWLAFVVWVSVTGGLFVLAARRFAAPPYVTAHPSVLHTALIGQTAFLTSAIFLSGISLIQRRPLLAGAILGALVIKPQLALMLPIAVVAARAWLAVLGALLSATALLIAAWLAFGWPAYAGFLEIVPKYTQYMQQSRWPWAEFASTFALARYVGLDQTVAFVAHFLVAGVAAAATWVAWAQDRPEKIAILATATVLVSPYLLTYDALLLVVPLGLWIAEGRRPLLVAVVWLLCALPVAHFFKLYEGPNTVPLAALLSLWALWRPGEAKAASTAPSPAPA